MTEESTGSAEPVTADGEAQPRSAAASPTPAAVSRRRRARPRRRDQGARGQAADSRTAGVDHRRHRDVDAGAQLRRGVLDGHRLHLGADAGRDRGGDRHRVDGSTSGFAVVGARARHDPRRRARQPGRPVLPLPGTAARPRRRLLLDRVVAGVQRRRPGGGWWRHPAGRAVVVRLRLRHRREAQPDGAADPSRAACAGRRSGPGRGAAAGRRSGEPTHPNRPDDHPLDAGPRGAGGHASRRRAGPAARPVPHRGGGAGRGGRRRVGRGDRRQVRPPGRGCVARGSVFPKRLRHWTIRRSTSRA